MYLCVSWLKQWKNGLPNGPLVKTLPSIPGERFTPGQEAKDPTCLTAQTQNIRNTVINSVKILNGAHKKNDNGGRTQ